MAAETCFMYNREYPNVGDIVVGKVIEIDDYSIYVSLPEYADKEAMIIHKEFTNNKRLPTRKLTQIGKTEYLKVLRVDKKGYIDLSRKMLVASDIDVATERWEKTRTVHNIMKSMAVALNYPLQKLYEDFCWHLYDQYDHAYDGIYAIYDEQKNVFNLQDDEYRALLEILNQKFGERMQTLRALINLTCYGVEGIDAIKRGIRAGLELSTEETPISIKFATSPVYSITVRTLDEDEGRELILRVLAVMKQEIEKWDGDLIIEEEPINITQSGTDNLEVNDLVKKINRANPRLYRPPDF